MGFSVNRDEAVQSNMQRDVVSVREMNFVWKVLSGWHK